MVSKDWRNLFDSSAIPQPKQVFGDFHTALFVCENEQIFALGKGFAGTHDRGWLREIKNPDDCTNFKKVIHNHKFRMILTETGKVFVSGKSTAWKGKSIKKFKGPKAPGKAGPSTSYSRMLTLIDEPEDSDETMINDN